MKHSLFLIIFTLLAVYFINGCDEDIVKKGGGGNNEIDTNILYTDEFGNILGGDTTDWCIDTTGNFSFGPAYPNPGMPVVRIKFYLPQEDTIKITIRNSLGGNDSTLFQGQLPAGQHSIDIYSYNYENTFREVCISSKVYTPSTGCNFCGDIKFSTR